jgi:hypothetical protein
MSTRPTNSCCGNEAGLVQKFIGTAYDVVKGVYDNLDEVNFIYDFLHKYGVLITIDSIDELKALPTDAKYTRVYSYSASMGYTYTDYLYVDGDTSGVKPNDPTATGSWIVVGTSSSGGSGTGGTGYIPWVYHQGSAVGGETSITVPTDTVGVPFIVVNGYMQYVGLGFTYDVATLTVTFSQPLEIGDEVVLLLTGTPAVPDNPNVSDWVIVNWLYNNGAAVGGESVINIPYTFESIPAVFKNGLRYYQGLATQSYAIDAANQRIILTEPLATNDRLIVQIGGEAEVFEISDRTLQEVARSSNVKDSETIMSSDTTQVLNGKKVVYDVVAQKAYGLPTLPTNVYISSVADGKLTYNPGGVVVDLLPLPESSQYIITAIAGIYAADNGASLIGTGDGSTVQEKLDLVKVVVNVRDKQFAGGAKGDWNETTQTGTDDTAAFQAAINYLASLPTERNAGTRVLSVPGGMYMTKGLTVPASFVFGFNMIGESRDSTIVYCNPTAPTTTPGLLSESEFVFIDNITLVGSAKSTLIDTGNYVTDLIKIALPDGRADCDLVCGEGTRLLNAANLITLYGRGLVFKGFAGFATNFLNIYCSPTQSWVPGSAINDFNTGMRHYHVDGCRFDQLSSLVTVTGTGTAIDYINGLRITNNDILGVGTLIQAPTATLRGLMINGNTLYDSGNANVVYCSGLVGGVVNNNIISKKVNLETVPTVVNDCLPRVVRADKSINGLSLSGNEFGAVRDTIVSCGLASSQVRITNNTFHQAFVLAGGTIFSGADCSGLFITGNNFTGASVNIQSWSNSVQTSVGYFKNNLANVKFTHPGNVYTPTVNKGGSAVTPSVATCYWKYDGYYCTARYAIVAPMGGAGGAINISTPMTPIAEFAALTSTVSGGGPVNYLAGGAPSALARVLTTSVVNIMSSTLTALAGTDFPTNISIEFEVKFRA